MVPTWAECTPAQRATGRERGALGSIRALGRRLQGTGWDRPCGVQVHTSLSLRAEFAGFKLMSKAQGEPSQETFGHKLSL